MSDRAEIELLIAASVDRALAGISSFERALANAEKAHQSAGAQAVVHAQQVEHLHGKMLNLAGAVASGFVAFKAAEGALAGLKGLEDFNLQLLHTTDLLGGNATAASTWSAIANVMGISVETIDKAFAKLSTNMNSGASPALKQMGIDAEGAGGKLRPINDVLSQAADYFKAHAGASNNAALANELFGKSGYQLLPILQQGSAGLAAFTAEARKYGLILDSEAIQRNAAFTFQLKEAEMAVRGLGISVGNALLPGISALGLALSRAISENLPAFIAGINRAMSYVVGFAEAFTGVKLEVSDASKLLAEMSGRVDDTGFAMDRTASSAKALADAEQRVRDRAKDATQAIDDQIRALQASQQLQQFEDQQVKLKQRSADEQTLIAKLSADKQLALFLQNNVQAAQLEMQLTAAKQTQANTQLEITRGVQNEETKGKIAALETQKRGINDAAQEQIAAMQRAARGSVDAMGGASGQIVDLMGRGGKDAGATFQFAMNSAAEATGRSMGDKLQDALFGPLVQNEHGRMVRSGGANFLKIGEAIGDSIGTGIATAMGRKLTNFWNAVQIGLKAEGIVTAMPWGLIFNPSLPSYGSAEGGIFTRPTQTWVAERGPEAIVPLRPGSTAPGASPLPGASSPELATLVRLMAQAVALLDSINSTTPRGGLSAAQRIA